jgi:hypothetical protein
MIDATTLELPLGEHTVPLALLSPASENANKGSIARVVESLSEFGQHRRLVVRQANREIIVGNHTYMAAKTLGWESIDVLVVDDDETKAIRRAIADNATRDRAEWDKELLAEQLERVGPVPGYDENEVAGLLASLEKTLSKKEQPVFPITPRFNESYDYVVVIATNDMDAAFLRTHFEMQKEANYKNSGVGTSHVLTVERYREVMGLDAPNDGTDDESGGSE